MADFENKDTAGTSAEEISSAEENASVENTSSENISSENTSSDAPSSAAEKEETSDQTETASEESGDVGEEQSPDTGKKKGFFSRKEKKDKKDEQIADLTDKLKRSMAEFDNYRKRTEKEKSAMYEIGAKAVVEKILPTIDNFERGLKAVPEESKGTPFADGMEMVYKQLLKSLSELGVEPIEAVGKEFDPNLHNAVMHVENEELGENIVAQEFQKGYTYKGSVVRHSMVQVAN